MLRALIVDDEIIVRVGLMSCIQWEDYGYQVVGSCESGEEALAQLDNLKPDVVFTDIKMPGMGGLELVGHITRNHPQIKVVVLSCLNEIDYVKQAIKLGAEDYILKLSLTPQTLIDLLEQLREGILKARSPVTDEEAGMQAFQREQAYRMLLDKGTFPQQRVKLLEQLGFFDDGESGYALCCCLVDDWEHTRRRSNLQEGYLLTYALLNVLREFLAEYPLGEAVSLSEQEYILVVRDESATELKRELIMLGENLNKALKTHLNLTVSMGLVDPFRDVRQLPQRYETARFLAELRFFSGYGSIVCEERMRLSGSRAPGKHLPQQLYRALERLDRQEMAQRAGEWFDEVRQESDSLLPQSVKAAVVQAWIYLLGYGGCGAEDREEEERDDDLFHGLWRAETLDALQERMLAAMNGLFDIIAENQSGHPAITAFRRYLAEHVGENITLAQAAAHCCLSKTYFCTLFKKETGEGFVDYFSRLKMEKAKQMLLAGGVKVYEVGNAVGISDMSYFNKLFRKHYGCSPGQMKPNVTQ